MIEPLTKRAPPAYQEYASDMLANINYRLASLSEQGLIDRLRRELWVNKCLPSDPSSLATALNLEVSELIGTFSNRVKHFFEIRDGFVFSPELDAYRKKLDYQKKRQIEGGQVGGKKTQSKHRENAKIAQGTLKPLNRDEQNRVELNKTELSVSREFSSDLTGFRDGLGEDYGSEYQRESRGY